MKHAKKKGKRILLRFVGATLCICMSISRQIQFRSQGIWFWGWKNQMMKWCEKNKKDNRNGSGILPRAHWPWLAPLFMLGYKWGANCYLLIRLTKITNLLVCAMGKWQHVANSPSWQRCDDGMTEICRHMECWLGWWGGYFMGSGNAMLMPVCEQWKWINNLKNYLCYPLIHH